MGCDYGQGYYYSRPVPERAAAELIEADLDRAFDDTAGTAGAETPFEKKRA
jgi:hypothetical protein